MARDPSAVEVYAWTLINDTRAAAGVQPVAMDPVLNDAAEFHTDDQISKNTFEHSASLTTLVSNHGWQWRSGSYEFWENHAWWGNAGLTEQAYADQNHLNLVNSPSHYAAMTDATVRVAGVGIESGPAVDGEGPSYRGLTDYQYITQLFGNNERQSYITGVAYDDLNADGAYDIGEGENGTTVRTDSFAEQETKLGPGAVPAGMLNVVPLCGATNPGSSASAAMPLERTMKSGPARGTYVLPYSVKMLRDRRSIDLDRLHSPALC